MNALELIAAERQRQIEVESWTPEHDDKHADGQMANAAACYAATSPGRVGVLQQLWPWHWDWWKPRQNDRVRELVKAGALIVAEIERLQRLDG